MTGPDRQRVLLFSEYYHPMVGGLEVFAEALATALVDRGHGVHVVTCRVHEAWPESELVGRIPVTRLSWLDALNSREPARLLGLMASIRNIQKEFGPSVILLNGIGPGALLVARAVRGRTPTVAVPQVSLTPGQNVAPGTLFHEVLTSSVWVVAPARSVLDELLEALPELRPRASLIHDSHGRDVRPRPITWTPPTLLCFGRLERVKGFDIALAAFAQLRSRHPGVRLVIAGSGAEANALAAQARELGIADGVTFEGHVSETRANELRAAASIVLMPSRLEGFGIVALEAARAARPVIASRIPGPQDVVVHGRTGILIPPDDPDALCEAIEGLLADRVGAERLGAAARERAVADFSWGATVSAYEQLFTQLTGTPARKV